MRPRCLLFLAVLLLPMLVAQTAQGQPAPHYIVLYAHSVGNQAILNALQQWGGEKVADLSKGITFSLSPVLGDDLQIHGAITFTIYLQANEFFSGIVGFRLAERSNDGTEIAVPGASVETSPIRLYPGSNVLPVTVGVGIIDHEFQAGSAILVHIGVDQASGTGSPLLLWDDAVAPSSLRLPAISPTTASLSFEGSQKFGRIFQTGANGTAAISIGGVVSDAIGAYRFTSSSYLLTAPNGTNLAFQVSLKNETDYSNAFSVASNFSEGNWQVSLLLGDVSGDTYSFADSFWVSRFFPVSVEVVTSGGSPLANANLTVNFGVEASWSTLTNATGLGVLWLPSSLIIGPMNLTVSWHGTQTSLPLPTIDRPSMFVMRLAVYDISVRIVLYTPLLALPIPFVHVTLSQEGRYVNDSLTGVNGAADFKTIPGGNYTVRVDYFFTTYQALVSVKADGGALVAVPFPHRTITIGTALALLSIASVVLVRRRRGKLYPRNFDYFTELTRGGLPTACFITIAGNSGSGKTVLLNSLAGQHLASGKSIYITNTEYPDKIRDSLIKLGVCNDSDVINGRLIFIDAYSAIGGGLSKEEFSVGSHTDLTTLGLSISKCLQIAGPEADIYLDSLNPLIAALRIDYLINFLQSVAAKVKANNGKFCVIVGTGIEKADMTKLEEFSDGVIETQLQESGKGQRRRLRIKKLRDKPYVDSWIRFQVEQARGIVFLTKSKDHSSAHA
ncbi:MAG: ATPase domain-containing protein [Candidatus Bathyarchaeia archaeon]